MKMDMSAKPQGEDMPKTDEGIYDQEQIEEMLESYLEAKKIEADPKLFAMVKDYAMSKNKMVEELFKTPSKADAPKSLKDLKTKYKDMMEAEMEGGESEGEED
jgi:hypothetical protein